VEKEGWACGVFGKEKEPWNWPGWEIVQNLYFEGIIKHRHFSEVVSEVILIVSGKKKETCSKHQRPHLTLLSNRSR
jgi:hypothetical protein